MTYAGAADLRARYPERDLAQLSSEEGRTVDDGVLARACTDAGAVIDGYLAGRYRLPLPTVPEILRRAACDIAVYQMLTLRPQQDIEDARKRYEDWLRYLERVAAGTVSLGIPEPQQSAAAGFPARVTAPPSAFGRGVWDRFFGPLGTGRI